MLFWWYTCRCCLSYCPWKSRMNRHRKLLYGEDEDHPDSASWKKNEKSSILNIIDAIGFFYYRATRFSEICRLYYDVDPFWQTILKQFTTEDHAESTWSSRQVARDDTRTYVVSIRQQLSMAPDPERSGLRSGIIQVHTSSGVKVFSMGLASPLLKHLGHLLVNIYLMDSYTTHYRIPSGWEKCTFNTIYFWTWSG